MLIISITAIPFAFASDQNFSADFDATSTGNFSADFDAASTGNFPADFDAEIEKYKDEISETIRVLSYKGTFSLSGFNLFEKPLFTFEVGDETFQVAMLDPRVPLPGFITYSEGSAVIDLQNIPFMASCTGDVVLKIEYYHLQRDGESYPATSETDIVELRNLNCSIIQNTPNGNDQIGQVLFETMDKNNSIAITSDARSEPILLTTRQYTVGKENQINEVTTFAE